MQNTDTRISEIDAESQRVEARRIYETEPLEGALISRQRTYRDEIWAEESHRLRVKHLTTFFRKSLRAEHLPLGMPATVNVVGDELLVRWSGQPSRGDLRVVEEVGRFLGFKKGLHAIGAGGIAFGYWASKVPL